MGERLKTDDTSAASGPPRASAGRRFGKALAAAAALMAAAVFAWFFLLRDSGGEAAAYRFATLERGPIVSAVSTSGTLNAVTTVQVGSQVSGQVKELLADYNSEVRAGEVIARIDPETFEARVRQAEAELAVAKANVGIQLAGVEKAAKELENAAASLQAARAQSEKARVTLQNARRNMERRRALFKSGAISESQIDDAQTANDQAIAQLKAAEADEKAAALLSDSRQAGLKSARAQVDYACEQVGQREAALYQAAVDLEHTFIRSPVDGVVIERAVDVGQTVAASLQAPKLFTIAQDVSRMQVEADVDEADIGRIVEGQAAVFSVDAFPNREFKGRVLQIRMAPRTVQNVVTYTVLVSADNSDKRLLPGMTAAIQIIVEERTDALKVPNAALRFRPPGETAAPASAAGAARSPAAEAPHEANAGEERLKQLTAALGLTESQQNQVRVIFSDMREKVAAMRRQGAAPDEIKAAVERLREQTRSAVGALLTFEQREAAKRSASSQPAAAATKGVVYVADADGRPAPREVLLGISDGTFTEVLGGGLAAGQKVAIGSAPANSKAHGRAPRFGF